MPPNKLLGNLDLFKKPLFLRVARQEMVSTNFGLFLSLVIYGCLAYSFSQSDFFLHQSPTIIIETKEAISAPAILYKDRPFAFAVRDDMGRAVKNDPQYFSLEFRIMTVVIGPHGPELSFEYKTFHKCNGSDTSDPNELALLADSYCFDNSTILLQGSFGDPFTSLLQINIYQCQNTTQNNFSCKPPDAIQDYFNMKSITINLHNTILQLKNYEVPSIETLSTLQYKCEVRLNRLITIKMQKAIIITDEGGILGSSVTTQDRFMFEKDNIEIGYPMSSFQPIFTVMFFSSNNVINAGRTYQTLIQAFALLGGLFSILIIFGSILSKVDSAVYLTTLLVNFLYAFQQQQLEDIKKGSAKDIPINPNIPEKTEEREQRKKFVMELAEVESPETGHMNSQKIQTTEAMTKREPKAEPSKGAFKVEEKVVQDEIIMLSSVGFEDSKIDKSSRIPDLMVKSKNINFRDSVPFSNKESPVVSPTSKKSFFRKITFGSRQKDEGNKSLEEFLTITDKNQEIKFNIFDFFKLMGKKLISRALTLNEKLFVRAQDVFENEIDIVKILQRIQDIDKLKHLLLNEHQLMLFDVLEKPVIFADDNETRRSSSMVTSQRKESVSDVNTKMRKAFDYYMELEKKEKREDIDNKLFQMIDKRFKTYKKFSK